MFDKYFGSALNESSRRQLTGFKYLYTHTHIYTHAPQVRRTKGFVNLGISNIIWFGCEKFFQLLILCHL